MAVTKKYYKKKVYNKKKFKRSKPVGTSMSIGLQNSPLSRALKATMIFTQDAVINLISSATTPDVHVFSMNGIWNPDITYSSGKQPRGFDQLMLLYDHYVVLYAKVRIACFNELSTKGAVVCATIRDDGTVSTNLRDYMESKNSKWITVAPETAGGSSKDIFIECNLNKFLTRSKPLSDPQLKGDALKNPDEQAFLHVSCFTPDMFTASSVNIVVTIEYTVMFIEPKQVIAS